MLALQRRKRILEKRPAVAPVPCCWKPRDIPSQCLLWCDCLPDRSEEVGRWKFQVTAAARSRLTFECNACADSLGCVSELSCKCQDCSAALIEKHGRGVHGFGFAWSSGFSWRRLSFNE